MIQNKYDIIVVGGGFFGSSVALHYAERGKSVLLIEKEGSLMKRASLNNQARIHGGYHYPKSILTGLRSRENYRIFLDRFSNCIDNSFKKYYAISKRLSNVSSNQFLLFCQRIGAPVKKAPDNILELFNSVMIESVFEVEECAFNAVLLAAEMNEAIESTQIETLLNTEVVSIRDSDLSLSINSDSAREIKGEQVFLCTYADMNRVLFASSLPMIPLRHELAEIALVTPPSELEGIGVTVMCGPFFSLMPYPVRGLYSFSHVRYTPHFSWNEGYDSSKHPEISRSGQTHFEFMLKDSLRYLPALKNTRHVDSLWEVKTVLPRNEGDDARPILFKRNHGLKNLHCIIGGKIDNVFDVIKQIEGI